jgi:hypothetical protein
MTGGCCCGGSHALHDARASYESSLPEHRSCVGARASSPNHARHAVRPVSLRAESGVLNLKSTNRVFWWVGLIPKTPSTQHQFLQTFTTNATTGLHRGD